MNKKLIAVDLDGTLLTNDKRVTERTKSVIKRYTDAGYLFVPVTGRPLSGIPVDVIMLARNSFIVTMNGAEVFSIPDNERIFSTFIENETAVNLLSEFEPFKKAGVELFCGGYGYVTEKYYREVLSEFINSPLYKYYAQSRKHVENLTSFAESRTDIVELAGFCTDVREMDSLCACAEQFSGIKVIRTAPEYVEIISEKTDKGEALKFVAEKNGFDYENVIAFGDGANDIAMLAYAGTSVAMGNASDTVKSAARCAAKTNEEDGVAQWLEEHEIIMKNIS